MERAAVLGGLGGPAPTPGAWQVATVEAVRPETPMTRTLRLALREWVAHLPGQHYDVRLTAPDGYQAQRSYSVASPPGDEGAIELTVDRLADGEVSPYLCDVVEPGDGIEVRGPIGGYFVWRGEAPVLLVGGGSGVVPLMCMLRHRRRTTPEVPMRLVFSVRSPAEELYRDELGEETTVAYTRRWPTDWPGHTGRVDRDLLAAQAFDDGPAYLCGSNGFVETAADALLAIGYPAQRILTERFGPTG